MRTFMMIASIVLAWTACVGAQGQRGSPAQVRTTAVFACPTHPQIMATWPARCPYCGTQLRRVLTQAADAAGGTSGGMGSQMGPGAGTAQPGTRQPMPGTDTMRGGGFGQAVPPNQGFGTSPEQGKFGNEGFGEETPGGEFGQPFPPSQGFETPSERGEFGNEGLDEGSADRGFGEQLVVEQFPGDRSLQGYQGRESEEPWEGGPTQVYPPSGFGQPYPTQRYGAQGYPNQGYSTPGYPNQGYGTDQYWPPTPPNQGPDQYWPLTYPNQGPGQPQYPPQQSYPPGQYPPNPSFPPGQYPPQNYPQGQYPSQGFPPGQYPYPPNDPYGQNEPNSGYGALLDELSRLFGRGRDTQQQPQ